MIGKTVRTYSELIRLKTFQERLEYLRLYGMVGSETFGCDRIFNQTFYHSNEWKSIRNSIISRDNGCDLGLPDYEIPDGVPIYIHHMNPVGIQDIKTSSDILLLSEFLITTTLDTHNLIHYGKKGSSSYSIVERKPWDTCPWRK